MRISIISAADLAGDPYDIGDDDTYLFPL